jgi:UDP-N-acetylmuramoyl-tripeptide--D-alanyl-D-alanine ligase
MSQIVGILLAVAFLIFAARRLPRFLHILQQEDYLSYYYLEWVWQTKAFDRQLSADLFLLVVLHVLFGDRLPLTLMQIAAVIAFAVFAWREPDPRKVAKKKLAMTSRAKRIYGVALALTVPLAAVMWIAGSILGWIIAVQVLPLLLVGANGILAPVEALLQKKYWNEAAARLAQIGPEVIGITGSFGKTSVKHILGHILDLNARAYFTPGSTNTPMGIARIIREKLPADCQYFLVEMGAYRTGSIEKLCRLTPPRMGVITAIGDAHYDRFGSLDAVARTKFALAEAVLRQPDGKIVVHESVMAQDYARDFIGRHRDRFLVCGQSDAVQMKIASVEQTVAGLNVRLHWQGQSYDIFAPLFGMHHADNIGMAFAAALTLGFAPERVISALRTVPQIKHRLEVKPQADGSVTIDDAYNSNARGFASALDLMALLSQNRNGARRILITPGIIGLGDRHDEVHAALGEKAAGIADVAIAVNPMRIKAFMRAYQNHDGKELVEVADLTEARQWLTQNGKRGDIVLYENDLPDLMEQRLKL